MNKLHVRDIPNSWGHQRYNRIFRTLLKDHQIDLNNHKTTKSFIEKFVNTYIKKQKLVNRINKFRLK